MIQTFTKRAIMSTVIRRNEIMKRSCVSIITKNMKILRGLVLSRNPVKLITELLRISVDSSGPPTVDAVNFGEIIAKLCVGKKVVEFDLAFEILECLDEINAESMVRGAFDLIDKCVEYGHIDDAMKVYMRLHNINVQLDLDRKERLVNALVLDCRVDDLVIVLSDHSITDTDLSITAEPIIMSGKVSTYGGLLTKYLDQKRNQSDSLQCPDEVARITRSIMAARLRRFYDSSEPSEDETEGMLDILKTIQNYHIRQQCSPKNKDSDIFSSQNYLESRQLCEIEKDRGLEVMQSHALTSHQQSFQEHLPEFEVTNFPYVSEGNGQTHIESIHRLRIRDLTAELKRKDPKKVLLFSNNVFPDSYDNVILYLQQRSLVMAIKNMMKRSGLFVDAVPEEEEEVSLSMRPTGHSSLPPPFVLHDISHILQSKRPSLNLLFNNDIFDRKHDVEREYIHYAIPRKEKHDGKQTPVEDSTNMPEENGAVSSSSVPDGGQMSAPEDEEPDKK